MGELSKDMYFDQLRELMKDEIFRKDFYKKVKKFRDYNGKDTYKKGQSVKDETKFGKYRIDTFCIIFCNVKEYAEHMSIEENAIKALTAIALKNAKEKGTNSHDIDTLRDLSKNYRICEVQNLLVDFSCKTNYMSERNDTDVFFKCVTEFIRRYNSNDWDFGD